MRDDHIAVIRAACIKANTDPERRVCGGPCDCLSDESFKVRLADVLLAIEQMLFDAEVITKAPYHQTFAEVCELYEFRTDDLEQQSDETIAFIHSLLREI